VETRDHGGESDDRPQPPTTNTDTLPPPGTRNRPENQEPPDDQSGRETQVERDERGERMSELEMEMEMARQEMDEDGTTEYLRQIEEERKKEGAKE